MNEEERKSLLVQYQIITQDMRLYAQQRFWVMAAYLTISGLLLNVSKDLAGFRLALLAVLGAVITYGCRSWEYRTTEWWGRLIRRAQSIEARFGAARTPDDSKYLDYAAQHTAELKPVYLDYPRVYEPTKKPDPSAEFPLYKQYFLAINAWLDHAAVKPTHAAALIYLSFLMAWSLIFLYGGYTIICK